MLEPDKQFPELESANRVENEPAEPLDGELQTSGETQPDGLSNAHPELQESLAYRVFVGPQGLRAGWSILVFVAIFLLLIVPAQLILARLSRHGPRMNPTPLVAILSEGLALLTIAIATFIMAKIEGRPFLSYGFSGPRKLPRFIGGLLGGVAALSVLVAALKASGLLVFDGQTLHGLTAWGYALAWGGVFLVVALTEESMLRGYLQFTLARGIGFWWAALLLSVGFGLIHVSNSGESPVGIFSAMGIGIIFCLSLWWTKSLWWAVGLHAGWDWAQSYLYGVADSGMVAVGHLYATHPVGGLLWSGGPTGPEGSLYVLPTLLLIAAGTWLSLKPKPGIADLPLRDAA